jgi:hypothetical protein
MLGVRSVNMAWRGKSASEGDIPFVPSSASCMLGLGGIGWKRERIWPTATTECLKTQPADSTSTRRASTAIFAAKQHPATSSATLPSIAALCFISRSMQAKKQRVLPRSKNALWKPSAATAVLSQAARKVDETRHNPVLDTAASIGGFHPPCALLPAALRSASTINRSNPKSRSSRWE